MKEIRTWKKVLLSDLPSLAIEMKDLLKKPAALFLTGPVGAGKTSLTQTFVKQVSPLKKELDVTSPTYSLVNEIGNIIHADFYRLGDEEEIIHLELPLYIEDKDFIFIEWGKSYFSKLSRELPISFHYYEMVLEINDSNNCENSSRNYTLYDLTDEI